MAQYIKKLQEGGTFKTNTDEYDSTLLLRDYEAEVLSDIATHYTPLAVIGRPRKRRAIMRTNNLKELLSMNYRNAADVISQMIKDGTISRTGAVTFTGEGLSDNNVYTRHALDALNRAILKQTPKVTEVNATKDNQNLTFRKFFVNELFGGLDFDETNENDYVQAFLNLDIADNEGHRETTNRVNKLVSLLEKYKDTLNDDNYDFSKSVFKTKELFDSELGNLITDIKNGWDSADSFNLMRFGLTPKTLNVLFSDKLDNKEPEPVEKSAYEIDLEDGLKALKAALDALHITQELYEVGVNELKNKLHAKYYGKLIDSANDAIWQRDFDNVTSLWKKLSDVDSTTLVYKNLKRANENFDEYKAATAHTYRGTDPNNINVQRKPWLANKENAELINRVYERVCKGADPATIAWEDDQYGLKIADAFRWVMWDYINNNETNFVLPAETSGTYYLTKSINVDTGTAMMYDYKNRKLYKVFVDKTHTPKLYEYILNLYLKKNPKPEHVASEKNGGILKASDGAELLQQKAMDWAKKAKLKELKALALKEYGDASETSINRVRVGHNIVNPFGGEAELKQITGKDNLDDSFWWNLASLVLDIASVGASYGGPVGSAVSGVLGLTSTATSAIADFTDSLVTSEEALKNVGNNLAFTALGMIPGGTGKIGKVWNGVRKLLPLAFSAVGSAEMLQDPEILRSVNKVMNGEGFSTMTSKDWRNITGLLKTLIFTHNNAKSAALHYHNTLNKIPGMGIVSKWGTLGQGKMFENGNLINVSNKIKAVGDKYHLTIGSEGKEITLELTKTQYNTLNKAYKTGAAKAPKGDDVAASESASKAVSDVLNRMVKDPNVTIKLLGSDLPFKGILKKGEVNKTFETLPENYKNATALTEGENKGKYELNIGGKKVYLTEEQMTKIKGGKDATEALKLFETLNLDGTFTETISPDTYGIPEVKLDALAENSWWHLLDNHRARKLNIDSEFVKGSKERTELADLFNEESNNPKILNNIEARANAAKETEDWVKNGPTGIIQNTLGRLNPLNNFEAGRTWLAEHFNNNWEVANNAGLFLSTSMSLALEQAVNAVKNNLKFKFKDLATMTASQIHLKVQLATNNINLDAKKVAKVCKDLKIEIPEGGKLTYDNVLQFILSKARTSSKTRTFDKFLASLFNITVDSKKLGGLLEKLMTLRDTEERSFKTGGIIKADSGVKIVNGKSWYDDIFSKYADDIIARLRAEKATGKKDFFNELNSALDEHYSIYNAANKWATTNGKKWDEEAYNDRTGVVKNYLTKYHNTFGYNDGHNNASTGAIGSAFKSGRYKANDRANSMDRPGIWNFDNLFSSITDDRRLLGRETDFTNEQLIYFNEKLKELGYKLDFDQSKYSNGNKYYYISEIRTENPTSDVPPSQPASPNIDDHLLGHITHTGTASNGDMLGDLTEVTVVGTNRNKDHHPDTAIELGEADASPIRRSVGNASALPWELYMNLDKGFNNDLWDKFYKGVSPYLGGLSRLGVHLWGNRWTYNTSKQKRPILTLGITGHRLIYGDFNGLLSGMLAANALSSSSRLNRSSDANINRANQLETELKAANLKMLAYDTYKLPLDVSKEKSYTLLQLLQLTNRDNEIKNLTSLGNYKGKLVDDKMAYINGLVTNLTNSMMDADKTRQLNIAKNESLQQLFDKSRIEELTNKILMQDLNYIDAMSSKNPNYMVALLKSKAAQAAATLYILRKRYPNIKLGLEDVDLDLVNAIYTNSYGLLRSGGRIESKLDTANIKKREQDLKELRKQIWNNIKASLHSLDNLSRGTLIHLKKMMNA